MEQELKKAAKYIGKRYDSVQIIVTKMPPDGSTTLIHSGAGNHYARLASTEEWIEVVKASAIKANLESEE